MIDPRFLDAETTRPSLRPSCRSIWRHLDRTTQTAVMRGVAVDNEDSGRRVFGAGIDLAHLSSEIPYLVPDPRPRLHRISFAQHRRPRTASSTTCTAAQPEALDRHDRHIRHRRAIASGACAWTMSWRRRTLSDAPCAQGERASFAICACHVRRRSACARQAILYEREACATSAERAPDLRRRSPAAGMDAADRAGSSMADQRRGLSAIGNRRAIRFARSRSIVPCATPPSTRASRPSLISPALIADLERDWDARNRRSDAGRETAR